MGWRRDSSNPTGEPASLPAPLAALEPFLPPPEVRCVSFLLSETTFPGPPWAQALLVFQQHSWPPRPLSPQHCISGCSNPYPTLTQSPLAHRHLSVSQSLAPLRGGRKRALATSLPCSMEQPACYQSPSSLYPLPGRPTIRDELVSLRQGRDFIWELADGEDGRLGPQNNHLVGAWMPGSFMDQRWVGGR